MTERKDRKKRRPKWHWTNVIRIVLASRTILSNHVHPCAELIYQTTSFIPILIYKRMTLSIALLIGIWHAIWPWLWQRKMELDAATLLSSSLTTVFTAQPNCIAYVRKTHKDAQVLQRTLKKAMKPFLAHYELAWCSLRWAPPREKAEEQNKNVSRVLTKCYIWYEK